MWSFVSGFSHLACFQSSSVLWHILISVVHSFLFTSNILLYEYVMFCLSIHQLINFWVGFFFFLAVKNNGNKNICIEVLL